MLPPFISLCIHAQFQKEVIHFESANPFSLSDIITDLDGQEKQQVFGQLTIPVDSLNSDKKYPLIIGVAGSMGWRKHHLDYLKMYQEQGFATFQLNSFKSRGITSTVGSQDEVTIAAVILDAYRALEKLAKHPKINQDKVAITGWSLGWWSNSICWLVAFKRGNHRSSEFCCAFSFLSTLFYKSRKPYHLQKLLFIF